MVNAWYMDDDEADQRLPHQRNPPEPATLEQLRRIGVDYFYVDPNNYEAGLNVIRKEHGYNYMDELDCSKMTLPNYEQKIKSFFEEHLHLDDEVRFVTKGSGYFDVRDLSDRWIRILVEPGDLIVLPAGIYHRFTLDANNYIHAVRLFVGEPVWTPYNRPCDDMAARKRYLEKVAAA